jgi:hypothetical protein
MAGITVQLAAEFARRDYREKSGAEKYPYIWEIILKRRYGIRNSYFHIELNLLK